MKSKVYGNMVFFNLKEIACFLKDSVLFLQNTLHEITSPATEGKQDKNTPQKNIPQEEL